MAHGSGYEFQSYLGHKVQGLGGESDAGGGENVVSQLVPESLASDSRRMGVSGNDSEP